MLNTLSVNEVHLYYYSFNTLYSQVEQYLSLLSNDERKRASQFHFEADHDRFIIARANLRIVLASYLSCIPQAVNFDYGENGKPFIKDSSLQFNLAHTREAFLMGVTLETAIGVDLELMTRKVDPVALGKQIFSLDEEKYFLSLTKVQQGDSFFRAWARKEAFIKALGVGMSIDLKSITTTPNEQAELILQYKDQDWQVIDLPMKDAHSMAFAIEGNVTKQFSFLKLSSASFTSSRA